MKVYAVKRGRNPGIYGTWQECREQVHGYGGAVFKSFDTMEAAREFMQDSPEQEPIKEGLPFAYIDGSFSKKGGCYGWGGFIFTGTKYHILQGTGTRAEFITERNIAGELVGVLDVMDECPKHDIHEINLYYDYTGIENYITGAWKAKTPLANYYRDTLQLMATAYNLTIHFIGVKGHTGNEGNELADYLAKEAVGAKLRKKDIAALEEFRAKAQEGKQWATDLQTTKQN